MKRFLSSLLAALLIWAPVAQAIGPAFALHQTTLLSSVCNDKPVAYWNPQKSLISQAAAIERASAVSDLCANANSIAQTTAANQPIYVPNTGVNYLLLPGLSGNSASTPDSAAISLTGSQSGIIDLAANDWTRPVVDQTLIGRWETDGDYGFRFELLSAGTLKLTVSTDGVNFPSALSSASVPFADWALGYVTYVLDVVANTVKFYTSTDRVSWSQLGNTITPTSPMTGVFNSASTLYIGISGADTDSPLFGKISRAQLWSGDFQSGGTLVFDANFATALEGASTFIESSSNAATVTINTSGATPAQIVVAGQPSLLFDGITHWLEATLTLNQPYTLLFVGNQLSWTSIDVMISGKTADVGSVYQAGTTPEFRLYSGVNSDVNPDWILRTYAVIQAVFNGASSISRVNLASPITSNAGTNNPTGITLGANGGGGSQYANLQAKALAAFSSALSATARTRYACGIFGTFHNLGLSC